MSDGTILNNVYASRIHKSNAHDVREEAERMLTYFRDKMLLLAASPPHNVDEGDGLMPWDFYVRREIDDSWDEIQDYVIQSFLAGYIDDSPEDCKDELVDED